MFWASGPPLGRRQERFEALPAATLGPHGAQKRPEALMRFPACFFEALTFPWVVLFRVRVRPRSMLWGLRRLIFASLKPSMPESLGGRRGSRSDMN